MLYLKWINLEVNRKLLKLPPSILFDFATDYGIVKSPFLFFECEEARTFIFYNLLANIIEHIRSKIILI